ncbi:ferrochelatase [Sesbania bispinosa]|nr:ferrochelatase [Sesbania bispinosa]
MRRSTAAEERKTRREKRELAARGRSRPPWLQAARRRLERSAAAARKTGQRRCYAAVSECGKRPVAVAGRTRQRLRRGGARQSCTVLGWCCGDEPRWKAAAHGGLRRGYVISLFFIDFLVF